MKWAYGVTTVPVRRDTLLPGTLASLARAGFDAPRLFVDGCDDPAEYRGFGLPVTVRPNPPLRVHGNWVLALYELYLREPAATKFAIFQDDILACHNLRAYLDRCPYPDGPVNPKLKAAPGYWNLYTAPSNQELARSEGWYESNQCGKGALALVFSREAVITLLSARHLVERPQDIHRGWRAVDGGIVDSMRKAGWKEYVHNPGLVVHTGKVSSINKDRRAVVTDSTHTPYVWDAYYDRTSFRGESWDALSLVK